VFSAIHKETDFLLAVKRLHVEVQSELAELQREITIMQQCGTCSMFARVNESHIHDVTYTHRLRRKNDAADCKLAGLPLIVVI
jgi:hypothetical protein